MPPSEHNTNSTTHDANEPNDVEMQAVHDSNDTDDSASSIPPHEATASRINRRARVDDDDDDERDRRHPSQRIATNSTPSPTPRQHPSATDPRIHTTFNNPTILTTPADTAHRDALDSTPPANDDDNNNTAAGPDNNNNTDNNDNPGPGPAPPPFFGGVAITIDLDGMPTMHPFPQGADGVPILPPFPPPPMGMGMGAGMATGTGFAAFRDFLTLLAMGGEREVEDPERAKRLVDALEEVPEGLVRRLEALGTDVEGGEVGCAICWDRLLDGEGGGFGLEEKEKEQQQEQAAQQEPSPSSSTGPSDPSSPSSQSSGSNNEETHESESKPERHHPKIVSLPCAHVFHAACLIPWFARPRQTTCPTCRFNVDPEGLSATPRQFRRRAPTNANAPGMGVPGAGVEAGAGTGEAVAGEGDDTHTEDVVRVPEEFQQRIHERQERELAELLEADSQEQANGDDSAGGGQVPTAPVSEHGNNSEGESAIVMMEMNGVTDDAGAASFVFARTETEHAPAPAPGPGPAPAPPPRGPQHNFIIGFDVFIRGPPMPMGFGQGPGFTFAEGGAPAPQMGNMGGTLPGMNPAGANPNPNPDDANANADGLRARMGMGMGMEDLEAEAEAIRDMDIGMDMGMGTDGTMDADTDALREDAGAHPPHQHQPPRLPAWPGFGGPVRTGNAQFAARSVSEAFASLFASAGMGAQPTQGQAGDGEPASAPGQAQGQAQPQPQGQGQLPPPPVDRGQIPQDFFAALFGQLGGQRPPQMNTDANANASENSSQNTNTLPVTASTTDEAGPEPSPAPTPAHPDPANANANPQPQQRPMPHPLASLFPLLFNPFAPTGVRMRTDANPTATGNINLPPPMFTHMPGMPFNAPARERKAWTLPPAPGPTLRQRIERREREAGLRCSDVSCGVGPSDEEPVVAGLSEAARRQLWIRAPGEGKGKEGKEGVEGGEEGAGLLCAHTFHPACLVSAARVGMRGAEASVVREGEEEGGAVEVACSVCRGVGNVAKGDWDEGVQALA
ncbi:hypothetical protein D9615_006721 [Tricholomella constricta]|uniref:RING-type domain-containing protein n=1 Tax=Tricholomella constricta TaxID=117010 RepID=A0A8H5H717_9AGAR|nr:hypothetical protein D9615_006721 [Tricholomella constricta]